MIRIILNINQFSPFLKTASGTIIAEHIDWRRESLEEPPGKGAEKILECNFSCRNFSKGYDNFKCGTAITFEALKPEIDLMLNSYLHGMTLAPHTFGWVQDSNNKTFNEWLEERKEAEYMKSFLASCEPRKKESE